MGTTFEEYLIALKKAEEEIDLSIATKTMGLKEKSVFFTLAWTEAWVYLSIIQTVIILFSLIPIAIQNINEFFKAVGLSFELPILFSSFFVIIVVVVVFVFGLLSYRRWGLVRSKGKITSNISPGTFLMYKMWKEIKDKE